MKTVFTDISQVAHLWANQLQDDAKNSGHNFYFSGNTIYSYGSHFPIAKHIVNASGEKATLFTERSYSNTTAKHISVVRQAARHLNVIYCAIVITQDNTHEQNFKCWLNDAERSAEKLVKAKKPELYLSEISHIADKANKYAAFFSLTIPTTLQVILAIGNKNEYAAYAEKKSEYELAEKKQAEKNLQKRHKKELSEWLKGKTHRLYVHNGFDYLRMNNDRVETTQAVQIPLETAKGLYTAIKDNSLNVGAKFMQYEVLETGKNIKIGCHNFKTDYLLKFGQTLFS